MRLCNYLLTIGRNFLPKLPAQLNNRLRHLPEFFNSQSCRIIVQRHIIALCKLALKETAERFPAGSCHLRRDSIDIGSCKQVKLSVIPEAGSYLPCLRARLSG